MPIIKSLSNQDPRLKYAEDWLNSIIDSGKDLTDWELEFVDSVTKQLEEKSWLSEKQIDRIEKIYTEKVK